MAGGFFGFEVLRPDIRSRWSSRYVLNPPQTIPPHLTRSWQKLRTKIEKMPFFGLFWPIFYMILQHFQWKMPYFEWCWFGYWTLSSHFQLQNDNTLASRINRKYNRNMVIPQIPSTSLHTNTHSTLTSNRTKYDNIQIRGYFKFIKRFRYQSDL